MCEKATACCKRSASQHAAAAGPSCQAVRISHRRLGMPFKWQPKRSPGQSAASKVSRRYGATLLPRSPAASPALVELRAADELVQVGVCHFLVLLRLAAAAAAPRVRAQAAQRLGGHPSARRRSGRQTTAAANNGRRRGGKGAQGAPHADSRCTVSACKPFVTSGRPSRPLIRAVERCATGSRNVKMDCDKPGWVEVPFPHP